MNGATEKLPEVITAAAQSFLGIMALSVIALSLLAYLFFGRAAVKHRLAVFVMLFVGVVAFGVALFLADRGGSNGTKRGKEPGPKPTADAPQPCRDKSHGVERYGRTFDVERTSNWMGGGHDQKKWCNEVIAGLRGQHPEGDFEAVGSSENSKNTCAPFNCPQYQYSCTVRVRTEPVYIEKVSSACP